MIEFLVFLAALAFVRLTRRASPSRPASTVRVEVHHYHHGVPGPGERRPAANNVVPLRRGAA